MSGETLVKMGLCSWLQHGPRISSSHTPGKPPWLGGVRLISEVVRSLNMLKLAGMLLGQ